MESVGWILEDLPVGVWVAHAPDGSVAYANRTFQKILGMDAVPESRIGDAPATYGIFDRSGNQYPVDNLPFSRVVRSREPTMVDDVVIWRPDGRRVNVRAFGYPV